MGPVRHRPGLFEVEIEDHAIEPAKRRVVGHGAHVIHRSRVAGDRHPVLVAGIGRRASGHERERLVMRDVKSLDRGRALDGECLGEPPERSHPCGRCRNLAAESPVQVVERREALRESRIGFRSHMDHARKRSSSYLNIRIITYRNVRQASR
jgi:hypothetical protein